MGKGKKKNSTAPAPRPATPGLVVLTSPDEEIVRERVPIFEIDGVTYTIERKPAVGISLGYLRKLGSDGSDAAVGYLLTAMLGEEAMIALEGYAELTKDDLKNIVSRVKAYSLGGLEDPKGN